MSTEAITTTIGINEIGNYVGDGDYRIQFTVEQMDALIFGRIHAQTLADAFVDYCNMTFASGSIPSCFRQDLLPDKIHEIQQDLHRFQVNFAEAMFNSSLIFEW